MSSTSLNPLGKRVIWSLFNNNFSSIEGLDKEVFHISRFSDRRSVEMYGLVYTLFTTSLDIRVVEPTSKELFMAGKIEQENHSFSIVIDYINPMFLLAPEIEQGVAI